MMSSLVDCGDFQGGKNMRRRDEGGCRGSSESIHSSDQVTSVESK